jgi:hypothetical protein
MLQIARGYEAAASGVKLEDVKGFNGDAKANFVKAMENYEGTIFPYLTALLGFANKSLEEIRALELVGLRKEKAHAWISLASSKSGQGSQASMATSLPASALKASTSVCKPPKDVQDKTSKPPASSGSETFSAQGETIGPKIVGLGEAKVVPCAGDKGDQVGAEKNAQGEDAVEGGGDALP